MESKTEIYQVSDGQTQIDIKGEQDTVWPSQEQFVKLSQRDQSLIVMHIGKILGRNVG
ncbi:hypothetical protein GCM10009119_42520 [Algoriphagus jejuensis]|uniref:Virulence RhuM family protein n=1 Tax=Algoriphagus jejuensis TaxID=419934 RepID=A0ABN1N612_9BACT